MTQPTRLMCIVCGTTTRHEATYQIGEYSCSRCGNHTIITEEMLNAVKSSSVQIVVPKPKAQPTKVYGEDFVDRRKYDAWCKWCDSKDKASYDYPCRVCEQVLVNSRPTKYHGPTATVATPRTASYPTTVDHTESNEIGWILFVVMTIVGVIITISSPLAGITLIIFAVILLLLLLVLSSSEVEGVQDDRRATRHSTIQSTRNPRKDVVFRKAQPQVEVDDYSNWSAESRLKQQYGYNVRAGTPEWQRRDSLKRAVEEPGGLGLEKVATHIAFLINVNKNRNDNRMEGAVWRWRQDLNWLRTTYYYGGGFRFGWPRT